MDPAALFLIDLPIATVKWKVKEDMLGSSSQRKESMRKSAEKHWMTINETGMRSTIERQLMSLNVEFASASSGYLRPTSDLLEGFFVDILKDIVYTVCTIRCTKPPME
jgi:hypothetical protein